MNEGDITIIHITGYYKRDDRDAENERLCDVLDRAAKAWMSLEPPIPFEGDVGNAMEVAVAEIKRLRAR